MYRTICAAALVAAATIASAQAPSTPRGTMSTRPPDGVNDLAPT